MECGGFRAEGGVERDGADEDGLGSVVGALLEGLPARVPAAGFGEVQTGAQRKGEVEAGGFAGELGGGGVEDVTVLVAIFGVELEEATDGLDLAADISAVSALASADAAKSPGEREIGWGSAGKDGQVEASASGLCEEVKLDRAFAEEGIADGVEHLAGDVAGNDLISLREPFGAGRAAQADAEIAAVAGEVERELGEVASVDAEGVVGAVEWPVEELASIADAEGAGVGGIAEGAGGADLKRRSERGFEGVGRAAGSVSGLYLGLREGLCESSRQVAEGEGCCGCRGGQEAAAGPVLRWAWE